MALFIANLSFGGTPLLDSAKVGILTASALAGVVGSVVVRQGLGRVRALAEPFRPRDAGPASTS
jgi:NhaA family Na+:H+ antiporter